VFSFDGPPEIRGASRIGSARGALAEALKKKKPTHDIDKGGGAFYGPKVDIKIRDCLGRLLAVLTVQVDFNLPERFDVTYRDETGKDHQAIMVSPRLAGIDRTLFGILIGGIMRGPSRCGWRLYRPRSSRSPTARMNLRRRWPRSLGANGFRAKPISQ